MERLAKFLTAARKKYRIRQADLTKNAKVSLRTLQRIESGHAEPSISDLLKITNYLNIPPSYLAMVLLSIANKQRQQESTAANAKKIPDIHLEHTIQSKPATDKNSGELKVFTS